MDTAMNITTAMAIFKDIESDKYTEEEKAIAIYRVLQMPTHMSIYKDAMLRVIKYLFSRQWDVAEAAGGTE